MNPGCELGGSQLVRCSCRFRSSLLDYFTLRSFFVLSFDIFDGLEALRAKFEDCSAALLVNCSSPGELGGRMPWTKRTVQRAVARFRLESGWETEYCYVQKSKENRVKST